MTAAMQSHCIPYREIPHTAKIFNAFIEDFARVSSYYAHPPTAAGIDAAARAAQLDPATRKHVVEILGEQNQRFSPLEKLDPTTGRNLERLAGGAVAIVTGQQVGLFSGPAYTFYKALSAVWWAVWAMIQNTVSHIEFDYMEWGMERVGRAEKIVNDPDYQKWLDLQ